MLAHGILRAINIASADGFSDCAMLIHGLLQIFWSDKRWIEIPGECWPGHHLPAHKVEELNEGGIIGCFSDCSVKRDIPEVERLFILERGFEVFFGFPDARFLPPRSSRRGKARGMNLERHAQLENVHEGRGEVG